MQSCAGRGRVCGKHLIADTLSYDYKGSKLAGEIGKTKTSLIDLDSSTAPLNGAFQER